MFQNILMINSTWLITINPFIFSLLKILEAKIEKLAIVPTLTPIKIISHMELSLTK